LAAIPGISVGGLDDPPVAAWVDGPGPETVVERLGGLPGWVVAMGPPAADVQSDGPVLFLHRTLTDEATAVCLARFYASQGRHWRSSEPPRYQEAWRALTGADDPAECDYPIAVSVGRLLLAAPDPAGLPAGPTSADVLSAKLAAIGYEALWAVAFAEVT